jgi:hypothetical protein
MLTVSWFSAGASSAVATKLVIDQIDRIIYTHIEDQHPDTLRFVKDCEGWFGKPVEIIQSPYKSVEGAIMADKMHPSGMYVNGPRGSECTRRLKRAVRKQWEYEQEDELRYVWGMDYDEKDRADRLNISMPDILHLFPLIERRMAKRHAHEILRASGIKRPAMYDLGYPNNNCIGCVKGGIGYWNKIRQDFPEVFRQRAAMERRARHTCIKGVYLDELDPDAGRNERPIVDDCGIFCEVMAI